MSTLIVKKEIVSLKTFINLLNSNTFNTINFYDEFITNFYKRIRRNRFELCNTSIINNNKIIDGIIYVCQFNDSEILIKKDKFIKKLNLLNNILSLTTKLEYVYINFNTLYYLDEYKNNLLKILYNETIYSLLKNNKDLKEIQLKNV